MLYFSQAKYVNMITHNVFVIMKFIFYNIPLSYNVIKLIEIVLYTLHTVDSAVDV